MFQIFKTLIILSFIFTNFSIQAKTAKTTSVAGVIIDTAFRFKEAIVSAIPKTNIFNSPKKTIEEYYSSIGKEEYGKSWALLTDSYKKRNHKTFDSYRDHFDSFLMMKVVRIMEIEKTEYQAKLNVCISSLRKGRTNHSDFYIDFHLVLDDGKWMIERTSNGKHYKVKCPD